MKRKVKEFASYSLEMWDDGDILVYEHNLEAKWEVMHLSFNPGDSLLKNLLFGYFMMYGFEKGYDFDKARDFAHTSLLSFLGDLSI